MLKKSVSALLAVVCFSFLSAALFTGCDPIEGSLEKIHQDALDNTKSGPVNTPLVIVGSQIGAINAGTAGSVSFPVTTGNIADGPYNATVENLPTGMSVSGQVIISSNSGMLTLSGNILTEVGTYTNLKLTINGVSSPEFTLVISLGSKTVSVGGQNGTLSAGNAGTATFPVTTANIANGSYGATVVNLPTGVNVSGQVTISGNSGTLTLSGTPIAAATITTLSLTIDTATSAAFTLTIKSVTVGAQSVPIKAGIGGIVTFPVETRNIANGQAGSITWYTSSAGNTTTTAPAWISPVASVSNVSGNAATVTMNTTASVVIGSYYFKVTIDTVQSNVATFTVTAAVSGVYTITPNPKSLPNTASGSSPQSVSVTLSSGDDTGWTLSKDSGATWLTFSLNSNGSGAVATVSGKGASTPVYLVVTANTGPVARTANIYVNGGGSAACVVSQAGSPGSGSSGDPWKVYDAATMRKVGSGTDGWNLNSYYIQTADFSLSSYASWTPIGNSSSPFTGTFDGGNLTISGLTNSVPGGNNQGLFGVINGGTVKNIRLSGVSITSTGDNIGGIAGQNNSGAIENCSVSGNIVKNSGITKAIGGIVGLNSGNVKSCSATGTVTSNHSYVGGVVGNNFNGTIENCFATNNITGGYDTGGVVGFNAGILKNCYATGSVASTGLYGDAGGVVGHNCAEESVLARIQYCYATGSVTSNEGSSGGIVGNNDEFNNPTEYCVALNSSIVGGARGRVAGNDATGQLNNNYARYDLSTMAGSGQATTSGRDGLSWNNTTPLSTLFSGWSDWNIPDANLVVGGALPTLKTVPQSPAPTLPALK